MLSLFLLSAASSAMQAAPTTDPCSGSTTIAMNDCASGKLDAAEAELARYTAAASARIGDLSTDAERGSAGMKLTMAFEKAGRAWAVYRDSECDAVYAHWSAGSIRTTMSLGCRVEMTRRRTYTVWRNWLTYMDSTPPILPEPKIDSDE